MYLCILMSMYVVYFRLYNFTSFFVNMLFNNEHSKFTHDNELIEDIESYSHLSKKSCGSQSLGEKFGDYWLVV
jgi:hypothetical protein